MYFKQFALLIIAFFCFQRIRSFTVIIWHKKGCQPVTVDIMNSPGRIPFVQCGLFNLISNIL